MVSRKVTPLLSGFVAEQMINFVGKPFSTVAKRSGDAKKLFEEVHFGSINGTSDSLIGKKIDVITALIARNHPQLEVALA